jgi:hypothetical protein
MLLLKIALYCPNLNQTNILLFLKYSQKLTLLIFNRSLIANPNLYYAIHQRKHYNLDSQKV